MKRWVLNLIIFLLLPLALKAQEQTWQVIGSMPVPVKGAQAVVKDSLIYVIGGFTDQTYSATGYIQVFNPKTNMWHILSDTLKFQRYGLSACNYRNSVLMFGGTADSDSSLEIWDFMGKTYIYDQKHIFNRQFATAQVSGNYLYIFGGYLPGDTTQIPYLVKYYIPGASIAFIRASSFPDNTPLNPDAIQQMSALINGTIFVIGGALNGIQKDIYRFDLSQLDWQKTNSVLLEERAAGAAVPIYDYAIAVIAGYNESEPAMATCEEIFVNGSNISHVGALPKLNIARSELTAVFYDSSIYVFGGKDVLGNCVAEVEKLKVYSAPTDLRISTEAVPEKLRLFANYPNPFNQSTVIKFYNNKKQSISLNIYAITGAKVRTLHQGVLGKGMFSVHWNGKNANGNDVPTGIYFYRLQTPSGSVTKRLIVLR